MPTNKLITLTRLIFATDSSQGNKLAETVRRHDRVTQVNRVSSYASMRDMLAGTAHDFVLLALEHGEESLPACLLRYPELQIMVVIPTRKTGDVDVWLKQGASDVVSQQRNDRFRFALKRMIDESTLRRRLRKANRQLASQNQLQQLLLNSHTEALMLWQQGRVVKSNTCFSKLIACTETNYLAKTRSWINWLTSESLKLLHTDNATAALDFTIADCQGHHYHAHRQLLTLEGGPAQLIRIDPTPLDRDKGEEQTDSVTGLLLRKHFLQQLDRWLQGNDEQQRFTATQIVFDPTTHPTAGSDTTLHELLIYRVANLLEQFLGGHTLMARTGFDTLVLAGPAEFEQSKKTACRIRQCIGSVGGLLEDPNEVRVTTLTLPARSMTARQVLHRLEQQHRQPVVDKHAPQKSSDASVDSLISG